MGPVYRQGCNRGREGCRKGDDSGRAGLALQALRQVGSVCASGADSTGKVSDSIGAQLLERQEVAEIAQVNGWIKE